MTSNSEALDWRTSAKADELREYIDKNLKPKKPSIGGLDRELIIDFVAKELTAKDTALRSLIEGMSRTKDSRPSLDELGRPQLTPTEIQERAEDRGYNQFGKDLLLKLEDK